MFQRSTILSGKVTRCGRKDTGFGRGLSGRWALGSDKVTEIVLKVTRIVRIGPKPSPTRMCERFARRMVTGIVFLRAKGLIRNR